VLKHRFVLIRSSEDDCALLLGPRGSGTSLVAIAGSETPGFRAHVQHTPSLSRVLDVPRLSAPVIRA